MGNRRGIKPTGSTPAHWAALLALVMVAFAYLAGRATDPPPALPSTPPPTTSPFATRPLPQSLTPPPTSTPLSTPTALPPTPTLSPTIPPAVRWLDQIETAERAWQEQPISHYRLYVSIHSQPYQATHDVIVRFDHVLSYSFTCTIPPAGCATPRYPAETFTIAGLFAVARAHTGRAEAAYSTITFDPIYHFPTLISYDHPHEAGEEESWQVNSFIVLE